MNWLLWREYRRNRWILIAGATGVLLPYIIAVIFDANRSSGFVCAFVLSCVFSQMTVALLAGNAVAGERADRSAEFIAYLPWRRSSTFASKLPFPVITGVVQELPVTVKSPHRIPFPAGQRRFAGWTCRC